MIPLDKHMFSVYYQHIGSKIVSPLEPTVR